MSTMFMDSSEVCDIFICKGNANMVHDQNSQNHICKIGTVQRVKNNYREKTSTRMQLMRFTFGSSALIMGGLPLGRDPCLGIWK